MTVTDAERERLRRTTRHRRLVIGAAAMFAVALVGLSVFVPREGDPPGPTPTASPTGSPTPTLTQRTVLIQATTDAGARGNMLTGYGSGMVPAGVLVSMPADLVVAAPRSDPEPLLRTVDSFDTLRPAAAVAATLGVRVDAAWRLDRKALAGLVDAVGGITVNLPEVLRLRGDDGAVVLRLPAGVQHLSGTQASWYAVGVVPRQSDVEPAERFQQVVVGTFAQLPQSVLAVRELLTSLGALAPSTIPTQELAEYLYDLAATVRSGGYRHTIVPATLIDVTGPNAARPGYRWVDYARATPLLRRWLPQAQWRPDADGGPRVLVVAPARRPGWIGAADRTLTAAGEIVIDGRGTAHANPPRTRILVRGDRDWGIEVARSLGIPPAQVQQELEPSTPTSQPWAQVDVILGQDYVPRSSS